MVGVVLMLATLSGFTTLMQDWFAVYVTIMQDFNTAMHLLLHPASNVEKNKDLIYYGPYIFFLQNLLFLLLSDAWSNVIVKTFTPLKKW